MLRAGVFRDDDELVWEDVDANKVGDGWHRYRTYCAGRTVGEARALGARTEDFTYHLKQGNLRVVAHDDVLLDVRLRRRQAELDQPDLGVGHLADADVRLRVRAGVRWLRHVLQPSQGLL